MQEEDICFADQDLCFADQVILELTKQKQSVVVDNWDAYDNNNYDKHSNTP